MYKKIIIGSILNIIIIVLVIILFRPAIILQSDAFAQETVTGGWKEELHYMDEKEKSVKVTAKELQQELQDKDLRITAIKAIQIAESVSGGKTIAIRLRRLRDGKLGYSVALLQEEQISLAIVVLNGTTGEVIVSDKMSVYPIEVTVGKLM